MSAVRSHAEAVQVSRNLDYLGLWILFMVLTGSYHIHAMLTMGDWDFWVDWKDRRLWVTVTPIVLITFPAAVQSMLWERLRQPWGATVCVLGLLFGEWVNRYFNFWGWTYFPVNFVFPAILTPGAILLDTILMLSGSYLFTAIIGGMAWGLVFYPGNWPVIAPYHVPVEYNGMLMSIADIQGYNYVRTGTPEYIRMVEKGTLRTFGKDVAPVSAFFSAFMSILVYFLWHFVGRWFSTVRFIKTTGAEDRQKSWPPVSAGPAYGEIQYQPSKPNVLSVSLFSKAKSTILSEDINPLLKLVILIAPPLVISIAIIMQVLHTKLISLQPLQSGVVLGSVFVVFAVLYTEYVSTSLIKKASEIELGRLRNTYFIGAVILYVEVILLCVMAVFYVT